VLYELLGDFGVNSERDFKKGNEMLRVLGCFAVVLFITTTGKMLGFFLN
jgi:hypothetical protein